ncbi:MAG: hypothetical protein FWC95_05185 [Defluviitaleaceae bacterium]|nr:hypothetical protein [Defluviitaleaceae bacterium]
MKKLILTITALLTISLTACATRMLDETYTAEPAATIPVFDIPIIDELDEDELTAHIQYMLASAVLFLDILEFDDGWIIEVAPPTGITWSSMWAYDGGIRVPLQRLAQSTSRRLDYSPRPLPGQPMCRLEMAWNPENMGGRYDPTRERLVLFGNLIYEKPWGRLEVENGFILVDGRLNSNRAEVSARGLVQYGNIAYGPGWTLTLNEGFFLRRVGAIHWAIGQE